VANEQFLSAREEGHSTCVGQQASRGERLVACAYGLGVEEHAQWRRRFLQCLHARDDRGQRRHKKDGDAGLRCTVAAIDGNPRASGRSGCAAGARAGRLATCGPSAHCTTRTPSPSRRKTTKGTCKSRWPTRLCLTNECNQQNTVVRVSLSRERLGLHSPRLAQNNSACLCPSVAHGGHCSPY
jgi:hypothetical protein